MTVVGNSEKGKDVGTQVRTPYREAHTGGQNDSLPEVQVVEIQDTSDRQSLEVRGVRIGIPEHPKPVHQEIGSRNDQPGMGHLDGATYPSSPPGEHGCDRYQTHCLRPSRANPEFISELWDPATPWFRKNRHPQHWS